MEPASVDWLILLKKSSDTINAINKELTNVYMHTPLSEAKKNTGPRYLSLNRTLPKI